MSLESVAIRDYMKRLDLTLAREEHRITDTYRQIIQAIFVDIVEHTPQFTGNLAQGWEIVFGPYSPTLQSTYSDTERARLFRAAGKDEFDPFERGDDPAVQQTLDRELPKLKEVRWNSKVRIVNSVSYAEDVDAGEAPDGTSIRPENLYYGRVFMTSYAEVKYSRLKNLVKITS